MNLISYTNVAIDIFHYGQLRLLEQAKKIADYHICGLYTDDLCLKWNGTLVMKYEERVAILKALSCVDEILKQPELDPTDNLRYIHEKYPNSKIIFFQGHQDWKGMPGTNYIKSIGGEIIKPEFYSKITRSSIRDKLNNTKETKPYDIESYLLGDVSFFPFYNSTKANTLASLKPHLDKSLIEELFVFTRSQWEKSSKEILGEIRKKYNRKIVVRSSSHMEDSYFSSYAGFFHSELNVDPQKIRQVRNAISNVIRSYGKHENTSEKDQILVQSQTRDVLISGVVFTRNIQNNGPYYLINFDKSSLTDSVTSGKVGNKIEIIRNIQLNNQLLPWTSLIESVKEIEGKLHNLALDIEFAIKKSGDVVIFQVRPIAANQKLKNIYDENIFLAVKSLIKKYKKRSRHSISDSHYTLSDMSFWNPAEIIGDRADNLSYSLYRYLILNRAWNSGLIPLGYKKINRDLMVRFANKPYIEVETSFAALLPDELDNSISKKLIVFYREKLKKRPELHDKIEFEIVHNCFSPLTDNTLDELKQTLSKSEVQEFRESLINLTQNIFNNYNDYKKEDLASLSLLTQNRNLLFSNKNRYSIENKISIAMELIDDARKLGTPQFSRMARLAFIGNQYLKGLVSKGIITALESESFLFNIKTIASELNKDFDSVLANKLSIIEFNNLYGHLRPGTYNITKLPYNKDSRYFNKNQSLSEKNKISNSYKINISKLQKNINVFLSNYEISLSGELLLKFIEETTKFRENFKFEFTKNLSMALELLVEAGDELGFNREMLSHLSIESIKGLSPSSGIDEIKDSWQAQIEGKKLLDKIYHNISLPSLVFDEIDFERIISHTVRPNFITNSIVRGELINFDFIEMENYNPVSGRIAFIENADPGYDWIFSKGIEGLITRFGGVASHMAIRCSEFGIPAAIGCGEIIFNNIKDKKMVELDCVNKKIIIIR